MAAPVLTDQEIDDRAWSGGLVDRSGACGFVAGTDLRPHLRSLVRALATPSQPVAAEAPAEVVRLTDEEVFSKLPGSWSFPASEQDRILKFGRALFDAGRLAAPVEVQGQWGLVDAVLRDTCTSEGYRLSRIRKLCDVALAASGVAAQVAAIREASTYASAFSAETPVVSLDDVLRILATPSQPVAADAPAEVAKVWPALESEIDTYLEGYELDSGEGVYTPSEAERFVMKDAVMGMLSDDDVVPLLRAALAAPVEVRGALRMPTGDELREAAKKAWDGPYCPVSAITYARSILALAGRPAPAAEAEPVAWQYELATAVTWGDTGRCDRPSGWKWQITSSKPCVPDGTVRNLRPLVYGDAANPLPGLLARIDEYASNLEREGMDATSLRGLLLALNAESDAALRPTPSNERG